MPITTMKKLHGKRDEGFTLIELLIVIVILGVLASVVVISVRGVTSRGSRSACTSSRAAISTAAEARYAQTGGYPSVLADFDGYLDYSNLTAANSSGNVTFSSSIGGGSNAWTLTYTGNGGTYTLSAPSTCPSN
jgi:general secretion pathway protein G